MRLFKRSLVVSHFPNLHEKVINQKSSATMRATQLFFEKFKPPKADLKFLFAKFPHTFGILLN